MRSSTGKPSGDGWKAGSSRKSLRFYNSSTVGRMRKGIWLLTEAKQLMKQVMDNCRERNIREWGNIKSAMRDALSDYIYSKTKRSPMILPIIMEVQGRS